MTLTELRYAVALAQEKHFGIAAKSCFVSQPTLSVGIKKLEDELGLPLFERDKNAIRLTANAPRIIEQAQKILEEVSKLNDMTEHGKNQLQGAIKIGAIYTIGPYLLPNLIPKLKKLAPEMPLIVEENYTANLREKLASGKLDIIFISLPFKEANVVTRTIYDENFIVLLPIGHPLTQKSLIAPKDLKNQTVLLLGDGHCFREQVLNYCPQCIDENSDTIGIRKNHIEGSSLETIQMMVASGLGITILPELAANMKHLNKKLLVTRPFEKPVPKRSVAIAWRASFPRPKVIDVILQALPKNS